MNPRRSLILKNSIFLLLCIILVNCSFLPIKIFEYNYDCSDKNNKETAIKYAYKAAMDRGYKADDLSLFIVKQESSFPNKWLVQFTSKIYSPGYALKVSFENKIKVRFAIAV